MNSTTAQTICVGQAQWIGTRAEQQDAFAVINYDVDAVVAVLADGMGGLAHGRDASLRAVETFLLAYAAQAAQAPARALDLALQAANQAVYDLACKTVGEGRVGTTLIAVSVYSGQMRWIAVGDSQLYYYRAAERVLIPCNRAHTLENTLWPAVRAGKLLAQAVVNRPDRYRLTSFLGLKQIPRVDRSPAPVSLAPGDRLLLCSDGVDRKLPPAYLCAALAAPPQQAAEALIAALQTRAASHQDNASALVLAWDEQPADKPA